MSACEICWTEASRRALTRGGYTAEHYAALLAEHPNGHDEPKEAVVSDGFARAAAKALPDRIANACARCRRCAGCHARGGCPPYGTTCAIGRCPTRDDFLAALEAAEARIARVEALIGPRGSAVMGHKIHCRLFVGPANYGCDCGAESVSFAAVRAALTGDDK